MGLFGNGVTKYKGWELVEDKENKLWYIRTPGRYGISHGSSPSLEEAKRMIDNGTVRR